MTMLDLLLFVVVAILGFVFGAIVQSVLTAITQPNMDEFNEAMGYRKGYQQGLIDSHNDALDIVADHQKESER